MGSLLKDTPHPQVNPHTPPALFPSHRQGSVLSHLLSRLPADPGHFPRVDRTLCGLTFPRALRFTASQPAAPLHCGAILPCAGRPPFIYSSPAAGHSGRALGFAGCDEQGSREHSQQASARSHSNARLTPLLKCPAVGQSCWTSWTGPQQHMGFQIPPHPC